MRLHALLALPPLLAAASTGCISYNDPCQPLVADPNEVLGELGEDVYLDRPNARHANNLIGQLATDAFVWVFGETSAPATFAVTNGGSIRAEGLCVTRNTLRAGPLTNGVLHEVLLFETQIQAVDLSEDEVWAMFEHSVGRLYATGAAIGSPFGGFLQVSGDVGLDVDCSQPTGSRVLALRVDGSALQRPGRPLSEVRFRVAMPAFILNGGDGYAMLTGKSTDPERNAKLAQRFGAVDANITAAYLRQLEPRTALKRSPRIVFNNCAAPARPAS